MTGAFKRPGCKGDMIVRRMNRLAGSVLSLVVFAAAPVLADERGATPAAAGPRIVAAGDFHGDYDAFSRVIRGTGLIDENGDWAAGKTVFIQTGDIADRGPDTRRIIAELRELQLEAEAAGGRIIALIGNHEAMVMTGDYRYLHPGEIAAFVDDASAERREALWQRDKADIIAGYQARDGALSEPEIKAAWEEQTPLGLIELDQAWAPDGEIGAWVKGNPVVVVAGDSLFVHGGLSARYAHYSVDELNMMAASALEDQTRDRGAVIHHPLGPAWYRGLLRASAETAETGVDGAELTIEEELDRVLSAFGVERIFVGHTPAVEGVKCNHDCRVIQIDTGMSAHYGGVVSFVEITEDGIFASNDYVRTQIGE